jgi:tetratricopeptide (TPR) repeat protein
MANLLRQARQTRGWTSLKLNAELRQAARKIGVTTAGQESLRVMISAWENGRQVPDLTYRRLLQHVFDLPAEALGFPVDDHPEFDEGLAPLVRRGTARIEVTDSVLGYFQRQLDEHTLLDNAAGPGLVLDVIGIQVQQVRRLAERGPVEAVKLASRFTESAGWLHQDSGDLGQALRLTDEAVELAQVAGDPFLTAYALMRKSNVLTALGEAQRARLTAYRAADLAARETPDQHAVCLRQVALAEAALGDEHAARDAVERALILNSTASDGQNTFLAYCTSSYLEMEHALCLLVLDQPGAAAAACQRALRSWPAGLVRDEGLCLVRLAAAQLRTDDVDEACASALRAIDRVQVAPSARTLEQLRTVSTAMQPYRESRSVRQFREALASVA